MLAEAEAWQFDMPQLKAIHVDEGNGAALCMTGKAQHVINFIHISCLGHHRQDLCRETRHLLWGGTYRDSPQWVQGQGSRALCPDTEM